MDPKQIETVLLQVAKEFYDEGPGWAQESPLLRMVAERSKVGRDDVRNQQRILNIWQQLFRDGKLYWGYDLDNPSAPFFHLAEPELATN